MTIEPNRLWEAWRTRRDASALRALAPEIRHLVSYARRSGCDAHTAEDVVQDALVDLVRERGPARDDVGPRAWLYRAVRAVVWSRRRSDVRRRRREHAAARPEAVEPGRPALDDREDVERLLRELDEADRELLVLRYLHDLEYREIAVVLGVSEGACRVRVHRAIERLRARAGPNAATALAALPLAEVADPARLLARLPACPSSASPATLGVTAMSTATKSIAAACALAVAAGVYWAGTQGTDDGEAPPRPATAELENLVAQVDESRAAATRAQRTERDLRRQLDELRAEHRSAHEVRKTASTEPAPPEPAATGAPASDEGLPERESPELRAIDAAHDLADELHVSPEVLALALAAYDALSGRDPRADAAERLAALEAHRGESYRALVALARGGLSHKCFARMARHAWRDGEEQAVIDALARDDLPVHSDWSLLRMLGAADSGLSRGYLLDLVRTEEDAGRLMSAAESLGDLAEARGLPFVEPALRRTEWSDAVRWSVQDSMIRMDATAAAEAFERHLRRPGADLLPSVVEALARIDRPRARKELDALLSDSRSDALGESEKNALLRLQRDLAH